MSNLYYKLPIKLLIDVPLLTLTLGNCNLSIPFFALPYLIVTPILNPASFVIDKFERDTSDAMPIVISSTKVSTETISNSLSSMSSKSEYKKDDHVSGTIYEINKDFGAYVAVDNRFSALIPKKDMPNGLKVGDHIEGRVTGLKKDGKIDISVREKAYIQMDADAESVMQVIQMSIDADKIMRYLEDHDGVIPFNDKASPQLISEVMNMSKNEFKRAVGNLLKAGLIRIETDSIRRI